jgi:hypothetical protein
MLTPTEAAILERLIAPTTGELSPEAAQYVLSLGFPPVDRGRMHQLAERARAGALTSEERAELETYEHITQILARLQARARQTLERQAATPPDTKSSESTMQIPPGIKRSQEALRRDLPELLENKKLFHRWVAYHGEERIGIARTQTELIVECIRRGFEDDEYYVGWIDHSELIKEEEMEES